MQTSCSLDLPWLSGREKHSEIWVRDYKLRGLEGKHIIFYRLNKVEERLMRDEKTDNINHCPMHRRCTWYSSILEGLNGVLAFTVIG